MIVNESMRTVIKVTEWRDGCVWKTKQVGEVWLDYHVDRTPGEENEIARARGGDMLGSPSTGLPYDRCFRSRIVPDVT